MLTPPGRGAVATVAVSGSGAAEAVGRLFASASGRRLTTVAIGEVVYGRFEPCGEEVVVCRRADAIEIHCHGGQAAASALLESLAQLGCQLISWRDWIRDRTPDDIAVAAAEALASAPTLRTASILLDQYHGALQRELDECVELLQAASDVAAGLAEERLKALSRRCQTGRHLNEPFRVVIAGRPNVGKSSLVNALVGYRRSIVYDQPGTTRDVVTVRTAIAGWPVELSDTAGLRHAGDALEAAGVELALAGLSAADLRVLVFDAGQPWTDDDAALVERWPDGLLVHSKCDVASPSADRPGGIKTSAVTGIGIAKLVQALGDALVPEPPPAGAGVPFTPAQERRIEAAFEALTAGDRARAADLLKL
ncbi:MAG TPA: GTPase [Pirellulales bacterium]|nr:GTPase [Pirellulales bacterium]